MVVNSFPRRTILNLCKSGLNFIEADRERLRRKQISRAMQPYHPWFVFPLRRRTKAAAVQFLDTRCPYGWWKANHYRWDEHDVLSVLLAIAENTSGGHINVSQEEYALLLAAAEELG